MIPFSSRTRISELIRAHSGVVDAIATIHPVFNKLKNPLLRKVLAPRVSVSDAARIGQVTVSDFELALKPLGFELHDPEIVGAAESSSANSTDFSLEHRSIRVLDVRPMLSKGVDPFREIMQAASDIQPGEVLCIVAPFEPVPLFKKLGSNGFVYRVIREASAISTYFLRVEAEMPTVQAEVKPEYVSYEALCELSDTLGSRLQTLDVSTLEMPMPMVMIQQALQKLPEQSVLMVKHHRVPHLLFEQLATEAWRIRIAETPSNVHLLFSR